MLSDPSIQNILSSIGINMNEIKDSFSETSDDNEDMEEDDATESERNEYTDSEEE